MSDWAMSMAPGRRLQELRRSLETLGHPPENTLVVTTLPDQVFGSEIADLAHHVLLVAKPDLHFGEWCNAGFDYIIDSDPDAGFVFMTASDNQHASYTYSNFVGGMAFFGLSLAAPQDHGHPAGPLVGARTVTNRIQGYAFMVRAQDRLRFDPEFRWWYADDDFDMQARLVGPVGFVGGTGVIHGGFSQLNPEQQRHADEDRPKFVQKWGIEPW